MSNEDLKSRLRAKMAEKRAQRTKPMREPRYDAMYFRGTALMDAMEGAGPIDPKDLGQFYEALDFRLLNLATDVDGAYMLTIPEYEKWKETGCLEHVRDVRPVQDAFAGAFQDTIRPLTTENYEYVKFLFGMFPEGDERNPWSKSCSGSPSDE